MSEAGKYNLIKKRKIQTLPVISTPQFTDAVIAQIYASVMESVSSAVSDS